MSLTRFWSKPPARRRSPAEHAGRSLYFGEGCRPCRSPGASCGRRCFFPGRPEMWPPERRRTVLLHELRTRPTRRLFDPLARADRLARPTGSTHSRGGPHRGCGAEREQACDDLVLEAGKRPSDYAAQLLGVARSLRRARTLPPAAMAMARPSGLETRLLAILDSEAEPARASALAGGRVPGRGRCGVGGARRREISGEGDAAARNQRAGVGVGWESRTPKPRCSWMEIRFRGCHREFDKRPVALLGRGRC